MFRFVVLNAIGFTMLIIGIYEDLNIPLILAALAVAILPGLFDRMTWPYSIIIDRKNQTVQLKHGPSHNRQFRYSEISSLFVDEYVLDSDTSPFKEGYQDFVYAFHLTALKKRIKLIRFSFRRENAAQMQEVFNYLQQAVNL